MEGGGSEDQKTLKNAPGKGMWKRKTNGDEGKGRGDLGGGSTPSKKRDNLQRSSHLKKKKGKNGRGGGGPDPAGFYHAK